MRRALAVTTVLTALPAAWVASASALYCAGTGKLDLFQFPFTQWLQAAPYWRLNMTMTIAVIGSAALPSLLLVVCAFGMARHRWRGRPAPLYGRTEWATRQQMQSGRISSSDKPF